jgi:hypothetical protein
MLLRIESWIEIASQPSSSSLSSAATDEIVTTGLHVQRDSGARRRKRAQHAVPRGAHFSLQARSSAGSSQEEYEESESDEDRVMTSSNENVRTSRVSNSNGRASREPYGSDSEEADDDDDDDENSTALGVGNNRHGSFAPQPNAFSHPPSSHSSGGGHHAPDPHFPRHASRSQDQRAQPPSYSGRRTHSSHTPYNAVSPSYRADHDAALRASLSTLLSCAAAARGLPKQSQSPPRRRGSAVGPATTTIEQGTLRIVPESVVMGEGGLDGSNDNRDNSNGRDQTAGGKRARRSSTGSTSSSNASGDTSSPPHLHPDKGKRKPSATSNHPNSLGQTTKPHHRITKKSRAKPSTTASTTPEITLISPTLLTWVISAGVVVVVSAISFSAGYAMGKEVGRGEAGFLGGGGGELGGESGECGKEVVRGGLRRLRRGTGTGSVGA